MELFYIYYDILQLFYFIYKHSGFPLCPKSFWGNKLILSYMSWSDTWEEVYKESYKYKI